MKRVLNRTLSMALMAGLVGAPVMTALAQTPPEAQAGTARLTPAPGFESLSKKELKELADYGARRGQDVSDLRAYADGKPPPGDDALFKIRRQALTLLLKRGGPVLDRVLERHDKAEQSLEKYKPKVIKAVRRLNVTGDRWLERILIGYGIERGSAAAIAPWLSYML